MKHGSATMGAAFAGLLPSYRHVVRDNLRRIHGCRSSWQEYQDITKTFVSYASCLAEALGIERMDPAAIEYEVIGQESLNALLIPATGFIVATAHVGAWDCAALHLQSSTNRPVIVVMEREANVAARSFQDSIRRRCGIEIVHVGDDAFEGLKLLKHLRNGGIVAVQLDRKPKGGRTLPVALFDQDFEAPLGPFQLASLASVPIIPVFCARVGFYQYQIRVSGPIRVARRAPHPELLTAAQTALASLEDFLRIYPTQWFHFERTDSPP
jgi:KDO2-lipid IV(A) lauroyltransferase